MNKNMVVSVNPHIYAGQTTQTIMRDVLIALFPAVIASIVFFGVQALLVEVVCVAVAVACECMKMALEPGFYDQIERIGEKLYRGIDGLFLQHKKKGHCRGVGARFAIYFGVENAEDDFDFRRVAQVQDRDMYKKFVTACLPKGLWFHDTAGPVSPAHYGITIAHTEQDIDETLNRMDDIFKTF